MEAPMISKPNRINHHFLKLFSAIVTVIALASCQPVDSEDINSSGIYADIEVVSSLSTHADVNVSFRSSSKSNASYIELTANDNLATSSNNQIKFFSKDNFLNKITYSANFNDVADEASFTVSLERPNDISAPNSSVSLPKEMQITLPASAHVFTPDQQLDIAWSPARINQLIDIQFVVTCDDNTTRTISGLNDDGTYSISIDALIADSAISNNNDCHISIGLTRTHRGSIDTNYGKGGKITAKTTRSLNVIVDL